MTQPYGERVAHYRLMADCLVLLASLALTGDRINATQSKRIEQLIGRLKLAIDYQKRRKK